MNKHKKKVNIFVGITIKPSPSSKLQIPIAHA